MRSVTLRMACNIALRLHACQFLDRSSSPRSVSLTEPRRHEPLVLVVNSATTFAIHEIQDLATTMNSRQTTSLQQLTANTANKLTRPTSRLLAKTVNNPCGGVSAMSLAL